jgi:membrane-associated phospholipid phosphatase
MTFNDVNWQHFWQLYTRLGEAQILIPVALLASMLLWQKAEARPLALWWWIYLGLATLLTTASKVAFIGWGLGIAELNFTGVSGHAMFAAAIYPILLGTVASQASTNGQTFAIAAGFVVALMVGISRVVIGAHSDSEVLIGLLLGGAASTLAIFNARLPRALVGGSIIPVIIVVWLLIMPIQAPPTQTHSMVTSLSLALAGSNLAHTRSEMLHKRRKL